MTAFSRKVAFLAAFGLSAGTGAPAWGDAPDLLLPSTPVFADALYTPAGDSTYDITFDGIGDGYDVEDTTYDGWCVEDNGAPPYYEVRLFSSYDPGMPLDLSTYQDSSIPMIDTGMASVGDEIPWEQLNYLLNHKQGTWTDIQVAIWQLIWGESRTFEPTAASSAMVDEAEAAGWEFEPGPGQVVGVLLYVDGIRWDGYQEAVVEVPLPPDDDTPPQDDCEEDEAGATDLLIGYQDGAGSLSVADSASGDTQPLSNGDGVVSSGLAGVTTVASNPANGLVYLATGEGDDRLYTLEPVSGDVALVGALDGGASNLQAMDFASAPAAAFGFVPGELYGVSIDGFEGCAPNCLFHIDASSGAATPLGPIAANQMRGISFNPITGELWGYDPGGKVLYTLAPDGTATYKFTVPNSHQQEGTGVDTVFSLGHGCDGQLYAVDIAYGVLVRIDVGAQQAYWMGGFGDAASAGGSFAGHGLDAVGDSMCVCPETNSRVRGLVLGGVAELPSEGDDVSEDLGDEPGTYEGSEEARSREVVYEADSRVESVGCAVASARQPGNAPFAPALVLGGVLWLRRRRGRQPSVLGTSSRPGLRTLRR